MGSPRHVKAQPSADWTSWASALPNSWGLQLQKLCFCWFICHLFGWWWCCFKAALVLLSSPCLSTCVLDVDASSTRASRGLKFQNWTKTVPIGCLHACAWQQQAHDLSFLCHHLFHEGRFAFSSDLKSSHVMCHPISSPPISSHLISSHLISCCVFSAFFATSHHLSSSHVFSALRSLLDWCRLLSSPFLSSHLFSPHNCSSQLFAVLCKLNQFHRFSEFSYISSLLLAPL